jgi:HlyD family secretion protein
MFKLSWQGEQHDPRHLTQDAVIAAAPASNLKRRAMMIGAAIVVLGAAVMLLSAWRGSEQSVSAARLRIAEVTRGTLVRDASVNGRVVAAVSPTLYAPAPRPSP